MKKGIHQYLETLSTTNHNIHVLEDMIKTNQDKLEELKERKESILSKTYYFADSLFSFFK